jgi:hypothetical protein
LPGTTQVVFPAPVASIVSLSKRCSAVSCIIWSPDVPQPKSLRYVSSVIWLVLDPRP